jgi:hypothetical protein
LAELAHEGFTGTIAELHTRLDSMVSDAMRRSVRWPKAPNGLGNALRRMATNLRAAGGGLHFSVTMCRAGAWFPSSVLRRFGKHRQLLPAAVSDPSKIMPFLGPLTITDEN